MREKSHPNKNIEDAIKNFLDYVATNPDAVSEVVKCRASDMVLQIDND